MVDMTLITKLKTQRQQALQKTLDDRRTQLDKRVVAAAQRAQQLLAAVYKGKVKKIFGALTPAELCVDGTRWSRTSPQAPATCKEALAFALIPGHLPISFCAGWGALAPNPKFNPNRAETTENRKRAWNYSIPALKVGLRNYFEPGQPARYRSAGLYPAKFGRQAGGNSGLSGYIRAYTTEAVTTVVIAAEAGFRKLQVATAGLPAPHQLNPGETSQIIKNNEAGTLSELWSPDELFLAEALWPNTGVVTRRVTLSVDVQCRSDVAARALVLSQIKVGQVTSCEVGVQPSEKSGKSEKSEKSKSEKWRKSAYDPPGEVAYQVPDSPRGRQRRVTDAGFSSGSATLCNWGRSPRKWGRTAQCYSRRPGLFIFYSLFAFLYNTLSV